MQTNDIALEPVDSSQIHAVGFDKATNRLAITVPQRDMFDNNDNNAEGK